MRCLLVLLSFLTVIAPVSAVKSQGGVIPLDPNSDRLTGLYKTPTLDAEATIERLQAALSETTNRAATLQDTLEQLQRKQDEIVTRNSSLQNQKDLLEQASTASAARIKELEEAQLALKQQATDSSKSAAELLAMQEELAISKRELDEMTKRTAADITAHEKRLEELTSERDTLREKAKTQDALALELEQTKQALAAAQAHTTAAATTDELVQQREEIETYKRQAEEAEAKRADLATQLADRDSKDSDYAALAKQYEELSHEHEKMTTSAAHQVDELDAQHQYIAQEQWAALFRGITAALAPHLEKLSQICATLPRLSKQTASVTTLAAESSAGRIVALEMNKTLRSENAALEKQLAKLAEFDAKVKELEAQKDTLTEQGKQLTAASKEKDEQLSVLTAQLKDLQTQIDSSAAAMEELQSSQIAPAAQLRAQLVSLKQLMGTFVGQIQRQLTTIGDKTGPLAEYIEASKENEKKLRDLVRTLKTLEDNVREFIDLSKQVSKLRRSSKDTGESSSDTEKTRRLEDQLASLTTQYNQLTRDANDRVDALQAQLAAQQSATNGSGVKDELARLQRQIEDERTRRETDDRIAQATLAARVDLQTQGLTQTQLNALQTRQTDASASTTQAMAGQAFAASMAASAASKSAAPSSSPVVVTLSGLQSDLSRYGAAPSQQFINGMPSQYQPYMSSMAGLPQFGVPTNMGQLTSTTNLLSQNRRTYIDTYKRTLDFLRTPAARTNTQAFNSLEATVFNAVSREGYLWYSRGISAGNPSIKTEAINNLRMLIEQVAKPLQSLKEQLASQGVSGYTPPENLVDKFSGFIRQLGGAA